MAEKTPNLREFTLEFFEFFQASVQRLDRKRQGAVAVTLPEDLAAHFGAPELKLAFQHAESSDFELVAHGSRVFDRMLAYLERRGALTVQKLPVRHTSSEELLQAVHPVNAGIAGLQLHEQTQSIYVFNWRITYRADDKREELYTVVLDENGARLPLRNEDVSAAAHDFAGLDVDALLADGAPPPPERNEEGHLIPPRLAPMTQLVRLAETARKVATYHADLRCVVHEADILPRLYQTLNRLTTYYEQQIQEVYDAHDPTGEKRLALEQDLARKIDEEVENHRLRVQVTLFSYAVAQMPVVLADLELSDGLRTAAIQIKRNRYTGDLDRPPCHVCGEPLTRVTLDRNAHVVCNDCVHLCQGCNDLLCSECGVSECPVCQRQNCDRCSEVCWACGERGCHTHVSRCPVCGDAVCHACQSACAACGAQQCRTHLRADGVAATRNEDVLICGDCAVRCPGCSQYSAETGLCTTSGQRFCRNCLVACVECGGQFGPGFYRLNPSDGNAYCEGCLKACPACGELTPEVMACPECGETCCYSCGQVCATCATPYCAAHSFRYPSCEHVVCTAHRTVCALCPPDRAAPVCPVCGPQPCGICGRQHCPEHTNSCLRCGMAYCTNCLAHEQTCTTCGQIRDAGRMVHMEDEPMGQDAAVKSLPGIYHWLRLENKRYVIYRGTASLLPEVTIAVELQTGKVLTVRKVSLLDSIRRRFGR